MESQHAPRKMPRGVLKTKRYRIYMLLRPIIIFALSLVVVIFSVYYALNAVIGHFLSPVDAGDATPVVLEISSNTSASKIADMLYENELIRNKSVFKIYVDFLGKSSKLRSGTYVLSKNMEIDQILNELLKGNPAKSVIVFTIPEGTTIRDMAALMAKKGVLSNTGEFLDLLKKKDSFTQYEFLSDVSGERSYDAEGYLFPDTYEVYADASAESIITKMLTKFFNVYSDEYIERADELNMTMDQVITLASIIEKEAKSADFAKVSAVFHNRLKESQPLESCATVQYIYDVRKLVFSAEELAKDSPYNTYKYAGLPVGPICNPGQAAIEAALYPAEDFIKDNYLFFCLKDPETGELDFSKTYKEHQKKVAQYQDLWREFDASTGQ